MAEEHTTTETSTADIAAGDKTAATVSEQDTNIGAAPVAGETKADEGVILGSEDQPGEDGKPAAASDDSAASTKGNAGEETTAGAPEEYAEFTVPDGLSIAPETLSEMTEKFKALNLSQEAAQEMVNMQIQAYQRHQGLQETAFQNLVKQWSEQAKSDPEIGGEAFTANVQSARSALKQFGTPGLNELLVQYGIGNHPEVIRVFSKVGNLLKEDQPGNPRPVNSNKQPDRVELMYGTGS